MKNKKTALITGANKGIGLETARQLGKKDITVLVGARDAEKGETRRGHPARRGDRRACDRARRERPESIQKAAAQVEKDFGRLDILVNNAGVMAGRQDEEGQRAIARDVARNVRDQCLWIDRDDTGVSAAAAQERGGPNRESLEHSRLDQAPRQARLTGLRQQGHAGLQCLESPPSTPTPCSLLTN